MPYRTSRSSRESIVRRVAVLGLCLAGVGTAEAAAPGPAEVVRHILSAEGGQVATSVVELEGGDLILAGYEYDAVDGDWDALALRVSADGKQAWRRASDREGNDYAWVVRSLGPDRFVIVGTRPTDDGDAAGYMQCIDGSGKEIWMRTYGGAKDEVLWAADRAPDGGFFLVGQTDSEGAGGLDFYVVRTDREGREQWARAFGGPDTDRALGVAATADGGALVVGFHGVYPDSMDILFLSVDGDGNERWRRSIAGHGFDVAHNVVRAGDEEFVVTGYSGSFGPGDQDGLLMGVTAEGRLRWMNTYGDSAEDRVLHSAAMPGGGFASVGYSRRQGERDWDMIVRRIDRDGTLLWIHREGGPFPDMGKDIIVARDGSVIAVGGTRSEHPPDDDIIILRFRESGPAAPASR